MIKKKQIKHPKRKLWLNQLDVVTVKFFYWTFRWKMFWFWNVFCFLWNEHICFLLKNDETNKIYSLGIPLNATTRVVAKKTFVFAKLGGFLRLTRTPPFFARHPGSWFFRESILTEQGITRVRFLHSSLHILCFDICIDWQENKQMTRINSLHFCLGACKTASTWHDSTLCIFLGACKIANKNQKNKQKTKTKKQPYVWGTLAQ